MRMNASRPNIERGIKELGDGTKLLQSGPLSQPMYARSSYECFYIPTGFVH
jgi:hypothetical protein